MGAQKEAPRSTGEAGPAPSAHHRLGYPLPGCVSCGDTPGQALDSIREAIQGHIKTLREFGEVVPVPRSFATVVHAA
jgi:hypothetical protein